MFSNFPCQNNFESWSRDYGKSTDGGGLRDFYNNWTFFYFTTAEKKLLEN
jgi:hypothetical protein